MTIRSLIYFLILIHILGCYEDTETTTVVTSQVEPGISYKNNIEGIVTDSLGTLLSDVRINIGNFTASTDADGYFLLENVPVDEKGTFLSSTLTGYLETGIRLYPQVSLSQNVQIVMVARNDGFILSNDTGGTVQHESGLSMIFPATTVLEGSNRYQGDYQVEIFFIDPKNREDHLKHVRAYDIDNATALKTLPRIDPVSHAYIRIIGDQRQELQIDPNLPVQIDFPISKNFQNPTASLDLLSFDEEQGLWQEEGRATLEGDVYRASLSHFSWWTIANLKSAERLCLTFTPDSDQMKFDHLFIVSTITGSPVYYGRVDDDNQLCFPSPEGEELVISVLNYCAQKVGEVLIPEALPDVVVNIPYSVANLEAATLQINLVDCDDIAISSTYEIVYDNIPLPMEVIGDAFEIRIDACFIADKLNIFIEDKATGRQYFDAIEIDSDVTDQQATVKLCDSGSISEGTLIVNGQAFENCVAVYNPEEVLIYADDPSVLIGYDNIVTGDTPCRVIFRSFTEIGTAQIDNEAAVGQYIEGSFQATSNVNGEKVSGIFNALRIK